MAKTRMMKPKSQGTTAMPGMGGFFPSGGSASAGPAPPYNSGGGGAKAAAQSAIPGSMTKAVRKPKGLAPAGKGTSFPGSRR